MKECRRISACAAAPATSHFVHTRGRAGEEDHGDVARSRSRAEESNTTVKVLYMSSFSSEELLVARRPFPTSEQQRRLHDFSTKNNDESARVVLRATLMKDEDETTKSKRFALSLLKPVAEARRGPCRRHGGGTL